MISARKNFTVDQGSVPQSQPTRSLVGMVIAAKVASAAAGSSTVVSRGGDSYPDSDPGGLDEAALSLLGEGVADVAHKQVDIAGWGGGRRQRVIDEGRHKPTVARSRSGTSARDRQKDCRWLCALRVSCASQSAFMRR